MERRERAALDDAGSTGRPTRKFVDTVSELLRLLQSNPVPCDTCSKGLASRVRTERGKMIVTCSTCATKFTQATPLERRRMMMRSRGRGGR